MQELGTLCFTCAPLTFNVLPVKEHPLRNYLLSETSKASILKLFGMRKKKTLNSFTLGLHTVHIELPYCYLLGLQVVHICRGSIAWYPLLLPLDHTWSPNSFSQKIWIYVHLYKCKILSVRWNHWDCLALSLTHKLNPFFEVLLWMSKMPIQNLFMLFLLLMLILKEA